MYRELISLKLQIKYVNKNSSFLTILNLKSSRNFEYFSKVTLNNSLRKIESKLTIRCVINS